MVENGVWSASAGGPFARRNVWFSEFGEGGRSKNAIEDRA
jgi:hypothetical protein